MWAGFHSVDTFFALYFQKKGLQYKLEKLSQASNSIWKMRTQVYHKMHTFLEEGCGNSPLHAVTSLELFPDAPCLTLLKCESPATRK